MVLAATLATSAFATNAATIGLMVPLSGPQALVDQPVTVVKEDDQLQPEVGQQAVRKLIDQDKVDAIVGLSFSNVLMGRFAPDRGLKRVHLMAPNDQAGKDMLAGVKRYCKGEVVDEVDTQVNRPDYSAEIARLQAAKPDALPVFYPGGMGINFVKQMSQAGLSARLPLYCVFTVDGTTLPSLRGPFAFGKNHMPVQDCCAFETARDGAKLVTRLIGTPLKGHVDPNAALRPMP